MSEHRSVWLATAKQPSFPALEQDTDVDVAVVGGGITGLTTALLLQHDGARFESLRPRIGRRSVYSGSSKAASFWLRRFSSKSLASNSSGSNGRPIHSTRSSCSG